MRPAKFLLVDDDSATIELFAKILRLDGYEVHTALDADSALRAVSDEEAPFDAVIMDLRMPTSDGLTLLRRARGIESMRDVPVAIVTGDYFVSPETTAELRQLGARIRFKPLWADELLALARTLIEVRPGR